MSLPSTFSVKWKKRCFLCRNPLEPFLVTRQYNLDFFKKLFQFKLLRPYQIERNLSYIKVINLKCRQVCVCCFHNQPHMVSPQTLRNREITGKMKRPKCTSLTDQDIYNWHDALYRFINRPDAEDYYVN